MKKIFKFSYIFITLIFLTQIFAGVSFAQETTKTPTPTPFDLSDQIDNLKSKIASKVAQLNLVEKRGVLGSVTDLSDTQISLKTVSGNTRFIDVDELTKFSSEDNDSFGISDIEKGMVLGVIGLYNKQSQRLQARVIEEEDPLPLSFYGAVYSIDEDNFTVTVAKENGIKQIVDIEKVTKTYSFSDGKLTKAGFSKIRETTPVIVIGFPQKSDKSKILGSRIFLFPEVIAPSTINLNPNQPTIVPSTGSGRKLVPIVK
ncbi:MAG: hypothetical protein HYT06_01545 [Candidatus Levybacteria bacterium]|nr:hypothetical protein [Candidatus Levybacteria bacterium]